jgi:hypothetical protein
MGVAFGIFPVSGEENLDWLNQHPIVRGSYEQSLEAGEPLRSIRAILFPDKGARVRPLLIQHYW